MTDHLKAAHVAATSAAHAPDAGDALSWLTTACEHIIAHLEAQEAPPHATSAPQAAREVESGQGDGGEATRAADGYPAAAIQEVAASVAALWTDATEYGSPEDIARAAIAAAEPHIRAKVAGEIRVIQPSDQEWQASVKHHHDTGYGPPPSGYDCMFWEAGYRCGASAAAAIARGEQP